MANPCTDKLPPRLLPALELPPYAYVSGKYPHPTRDPKGHSYQRRVTREVLKPGDWRQCQLYLWGIDLFNFGFYWEAHEAWESLWQAEGRKGIIADFLKGLIALAAAGVKARQGQLAGIRHHAARAKTLLAALHSNTERAPEVFLGIDLPNLIANAARLSKRPEQALPQADGAAVVVIPFPLLVTSGGPA